MLVKLYVEYSQIKKEKKIREINLTSNKGKTVVSKIGYTFFLFLFLF